MGLHARRKPIGLSDGGASGGIKLVELLFQLGQVLADQVGCAAPSCGFCAEQARCWVVKAGGVFWQEQLDHSRAGHGLDLEGLVLQRNGGVGHGFFLLPQTIGTSAACGIRALRDALAMYLLCAQASGLE